jgi:hypothetical protein
MFGLPSVGAVSLQLSARLCSDRRSQAFHGTVIPPLTLILKTDCGFAIHSEAEG